MKNDRPVRRPEANGAFRMRLLMVCFLFIIGVLLGIFAHGIVTAQDNHLLQTYLLEFAQVGAGAEDRPDQHLGVVLKITAQEHHGTEPTPSRDPRGPAERSHPLAVAGGAPERRLCGSSRRPPGSSAAGQIPAASTEPRPW